MTNMDCDDDDAMTVGDDDLDDFYVCDAYDDGLLDCYDNDENTYPGAGYN